MNPTGPAQSAYPGFARPAWDSQAVFRRVLEAMAHPGRSGDVSVALETPTGLDVATAAVCLTLMDFETPVWIQPSPAADAVSAYVRFQCGSPVVSDPAEAAFALAMSPVTMPALTVFAMGNAEQPHLGATVVLQVPGLDSGAPVTLRGPGIAQTQTLRVAGLSSDFWTQWRVNQRAFPQGVDVIFTCGSRVAALPRTCSVEA